MHCSDLERLLEACLDGQLGEPRRSALLQHLALCRPCRERVESLRQFEAELQGRLRAMRCEVSLWEPLALEMTAPPPEGRAPLLPAPVPAEPLRVAPRRPRPPRHPLRIAPPRTTVRRRPARPRLQALAGLALLVAALGSLVDLATGWLAGSRTNTLYRAYVEGELPLTLETSETAELAGWLDQRLGGPVSLPPASAGLRLVGGTDQVPGDPEAAAVVYAVEEEPLLLLIGAAKDAAAPPARPPARAPVSSVEDGLTRLDWQKGERSYSLVGPLPADSLVSLTAP